MDTHPPPKKLASLAERVKAEKSYHAKVLSPINRNNTMDSISEDEDFFDKKGMDNISYKSRKSVISKDDSEPEEKQSRCKRIWLGFKAVMKHIISFAVSMGYMLAGALLFVYLELGNEVSSCFELAHNFEAKFNATLGSSISLAASGMNDSALEAAMSKVLMGYSADLYALGFDPSLNCSSLGEPDNLPNWNFLNAALFTLTIMTTVGYGHISPSTSWGRIVCIIYSVFAIPIMMVFLVGVGDLLARVFRFTYLNTCCCKCFIKHYRRKSGVHTENKGEENLVDEFHENQEKPPAKIWDDGEAVVIEDDEDIEEEDEDSDEEINVPITISIIVLIVYILIGGGLFQIWEDQWTLVDGTYFSFITLSTIGFGDLYPTANQGIAGNDGALVEIFVGMLYILLGLAVLSMCLQMIQDEVINKLTWLIEQARKCCKKKNPEDANNKMPEDKLKSKEQDDDYLSRPASVVMETNKGFSQTEC